MNFIAMVLRKKQKTARPPKRMASGALPFGGKIEWEVR